MAARIRLNLAYDGSEYYGWQVQPDKITVQAILEKALSRLYSDQPVKVYAAGRTDRGVHAVGQVVHYNETSPRDINIVRKALSAILPPDIQVWEIRQVDSDFHARFKARERVYGYRVLNHNNLFLRRFSWYPGKTYEMDALKSISRNFLGKHNFRQFSTSPDPDESCICEIRSIQCISQDNDLLIVIKADRFLRRLVRTLVGTMIDTASGRLPEENIKKALTGENIRVGTPAPPQGLALLHVKYDNDLPSDIPPHSPWSVYNEVIY